MGTGAARVVSLCYSVDYYAVSGEAGEVNYTHT